MVLSLLVVLGGLALLFSRGGAGEARSTVAAAQGERGMETVPYLSQTPVRKFAKAEQVLKPGLDYYAELETTKGKFLVDLYEEQAPKTVNSFVFWPSTTTSTASSGTG